MPQFVVELSDEEVKALEWDMISVQDWVDNAIHNKARQCTDEICRLALEDQAEEVLTLPEKKQAVAALAAQGTVISTVKGLPPDLKAQIVSWARVQSAAERQAEKPEE